MAHTRLLILHALTPIHVGTGRGEGLVDLPVARDSVTRHPLIPGSGVKGPLRAASRVGWDGEGAEPEATQHVFGPDTAHASDYASALRFSDARLVALPVPSDGGTFAWVTSPLVLARLVRDAEGVATFPKRLPAPGNVALCARDSVLPVSAGVVLDGQAFTRGEDKAWGAALAKLFFGDGPWSEMFRQRLAIVSDDAFDELAETCTDVRAHIRIDPKSGTVDKGALWYEESVPSESIFASVVLAVPNRKVTAEQALGTLGDLAKSRVTFGGGKTTGMGVMRLRLVGGGR